MDKNKSNKVSGTGTDKLHSMPVKYIRQPFPISAMQADLSRQQIRIIVGIMQNIQDGIQSMFEKGRRDENGQLLLFPEMNDSDIVEIDFKYNEVVNRTDAYKNIELIADKFKKMTFRYEDKEKGEVTLENFVYKVIYPTKYSRRDKIRFIFTGEQAKAAFNFTKYSRYLQSVAYSAESKHTARIYMLITSARGFDKDNIGVFHWYVGYDELRRILGCDDKDEHGKWYRKSQKLYKHFKSDVLRTAERELKCLADEGKSDCWFEFRELFGEQRSEPDRLDFVVYLSEMGRLESMRLQNNATANELVRFMVEKLEMSEHKSLTIINRIDINKIDAFSEEVHSIAKRIAERGDAVNNRTSYLEECLRAAVEQFLPKQEETSPPSHSTKELSPISDEFPPVWNQAVDRFLKEIGYTQTDKDIDGFLRHRIARVEQKGNFFIITAESKVAWEMFGKDNAVLLKKILEQTDSNINVFFSDLIYNKYYTIES